MRDFTDTALLATAALLLAALPLRAAAQGPGGDDPWKGKTRDEVVQLLGEPDKVANAGRDGERLTYKLLQVDPADLIQPGLRLIPVPGVGLVGQASKTRSGTDTLAIGPTEYDDKGRPTGGGIASSESVTMSYDPKTGKVERSGPDNPPPAGRLKLRFVLGADGRVVDWSVTGGR